MRELLTNPFYAGFVRYRGMREALTGKRSRRADARHIIGLHEPLISRELFDQAQNVRAARAGTRRGQSSKQHRAYLLQGIAHCAGCGERMTCTCSETGKLRYTCTADRRGLDCEWSGWSVREEVLMPQIERVIAALRLPDRIMRRAAELAQDDERADHSQTRRAEIVAEMKRLDYLFQKGRKTQADYDRETARLEAELALLQPPEQANIEASGIALAELIDAWRAALGDNTARHEILSALLESVKVEPQTGRITEWRPRPEFAPLFRGVIEVGATGLEPVTFAMSTQRSNQLSYAPG